MKILGISALLSLAAPTFLPAAAPLPDAQAADWTVLFANDTCPDYTWGNTEAQTRKNFAELIRSHLEEITRTDDQPPE